MLFHINLCQTCVKSTNNKFSYSIIDMIPESCHKIPKLAITTDTKISFWKIVLLIYQSQVLLHFNLHQNMCLTNKKHTSPLKPVHNQSETNQQTPALIPYCNTITQTSRLPTLQPSKQIQDQVLFHMHLHQNLYPTCQQQITQHQHWYHLGLLSQDHQYLHHYSPKISIWKPYLYFFIMPKCYFICISIKSYS